MRKRLLGSVAALAAGAGLAFGPGSRAAAAPPMVDPVPAAAVAPNGGGPIAPLPESLPPGMMPPGPGGYGPDGFGGPGAGGPGGLFGAAGQGGAAGYTLPRSWFQVEYLLWKMRNGPTLPPLAVQGTVANGVDPTLPGSVVLFGGNETRWDMSNGARFTFGAWLPGSTRVGLEGNIFVTEVKPAARGYASGPLGIPILGTPFINEQTGAFDSLFASNIGTPGSILARATTQIFGSELNLLGNVYRAVYFDARIFAGVRYFALEEQTSLDFNSPGNPNGFFQGAADVGPIQMEDRFSTRNWFYGGQLGWQFQYRWRSLSVDFDNRIAFGVMHHILDVNGFSQSNGVRVPGGLFTQISNIRQAEDNEFSAIPQIHAALGWQLTQCLRFTTGFDFLYVPAVIRPGNQIDQTVNPTLVPFRPEFGTTPLPGVPNTARPGPLFVTSDFWALGVSFGLNLRF